MVSDLLTPRFPSRNLLRNDLAASLESRLDTHTIILFVYIANSASKEASKMTIDFPTSRVLSPGLGKWLIYEHRQVLQRT